MRIPARAARVLAVVLAASAGHPAAAQEPSGVLFLVQAVEDAGEVNAYVEPIALLLPDGYQDPSATMEDSAVAAFNAHWFPAGRRYGVLWRGEQAGTAAIIASHEPSCVGLAAIATMTPARGNGWLAVAGEGVPAQPGAPWLRDASAQERQTLDRMAAALFAAHGIDVAARRGADTSVATVIFHRNARPVLVGSYTLRTTEVVLQQASAFIIAEDTQDGYRPAFVAFHEGRTPHLARSVLLDALDLDGDSSPELVLQNGYLKSWDFTILTRDEHGWTQVYRGAGAGC